MMVKENNAYNMIPFHRMNYFDVKSLHESKNQKHKATIGIDVLITPQGA